MLCVCKWLHTSFQLPLNPVLHRYHSLPVDGAVHLGAKGPGGGGLSSISQHIMDEWQTRKYKEIRIKNLSYDKWDSVRKEVMLKGLRNKFDQKQT